MADEDEEQMRATLHNYFILSHDTLRGVSISQDLNHQQEKKSNYYYWNDKPPLPDTKDRKQILIKGANNTPSSAIPSCLRCAVWISSVYKLANDQMPQAQADTFATLGKIQSIEYAWSLVVKECLPSLEEDPHLTDVLYPLFQGGMTLSEMQQNRNKRNDDFGMSDDGRLALTKVLVCAGEK